MVARPKTIDLRVGEARILRDLSCSLFDLGSTTLTMELKDWEYQSSGYAPLVKFLEEKHGAPIVICNGANQALHAAIFALKQKGFLNLGLKIPYWNRFPEIAKLIGINPVPYFGEIDSEEKKLPIDSYLMTMPNNPDGAMPSLYLLRLMSSICAERKIPLIHDAVYYTRSYLPVDYPIEAIGDMQLFSASKSYGLSSLRVGYIVVHNPEFLKSLKEFMEVSTVGVSIPSQKLLMHLLQRQEQVPMLREAFEKQSREEIGKAKAIFKRISSELIELPENFDRACGVFAWVKPRAPDVFSRAKVEVLPGEIFGAPGFVRINLAAGNEMISEMVSRVNGLQ